MGIFKKIDRFFFTSRNQKEAYLKALLYMTIILMIASLFAVVSINIDQTISESEEEELQQALDKVETQLHDEIILNGMTVEDGNLSMHVISKWGSEYQEDVVSNLEEEDIDYPYIEYRELEEDTKLLNKGDIVVEKVFVPKGIIGFDSED